MRAIDADKLDGVLENINDDCLEMAEKLMEMSAEKDELSKIMST